MEGVLAALCCGAGALLRFQELDAVWSRNYRLPYGEARVAFEQGSVRLLLPVAVAAACSASCGASSGAGRRGPVRTNTDTLGGIDAEWS